MRTWIEIDKELLYQNVTLTSQLSKPAALGAVLKSNAYGHGLTIIAELLSHTTAVTWFLVATVEEALLLRSLGHHKQILVLSQIEGDIAAALHAHIILPIFDQHSIIAIAQVAKKYNTQARVHIKVDTGMRRLGYDVSELSHVMQQLALHPQLVLEGVFTHLATANSEDTSFVEEQSTLFEQACRIIDPQHLLCRHMYSSGYLWRTERTDMVRVGTMLYGSWKSAVHKARIQSMVPDAQVTTIMNWKTRIIQCKWIEKGATIGYERTYQAARATRIAILPVGYADGYPRRLSNQGSVMVGTQYAPIVGIISMNLMHIDITEIPHAQVGDEVILIGSPERTTPASLAMQLSTNPNEITAALQASIPRIVKDPGT